jgi:transposase
MRVRYDGETRAKAARPVQERQGDYESEFAAIKAVSSQLGITADTLRKWVRQSEVDTGQKQGLSTDSTLELRELRRKWRELEQWKYCMVSDAWLGSRPQKACPVQLRSRR